MLVDGLALSSFRRDLSDSSTSPMWSNMRQAQDPGATRPFEQSLADAMTGPTRLPETPVRSQVYPWQNDFASGSSRSLRLILGKMPQLILERLDLSFRIHQLMFLLPSISRFTCALAYPPRHASSRCFRV